MNPAGRGRVTPDYSFKVDFGLLLAIRNTHPALAENPWQAPLEVIL